MYLFFCNPCLLDLIYPSHLLGQTQEERLVSDSVRFIDS